MTRPLKILHVVRQFDPAVGGLESYVKSMVRRQQAAGHSCEVLTLNRVFHGGKGVLPARDNVAGISVRRVGFVGFRRYFIPFVAPSYFKQFDIVHVHNTDVFYDYVALVSLFVKTPIFATTHGGFFHTKNFSLLKKIYFNTITRFSSSRYRTLFAISQNDYDTFKGLSKSIVFQPNAVEAMGDFITQGRDFVYLGRLAKHKHVERLIDAHAVLVKTHHSEARLHIVGPEWDVSVADLKLHAQKAGITDHVVFHGCLDPAQMPDVLRQCGYFVSASAFEGFGMSMLEAMSVGLIPFVQPNAAFAELVGKADLGSCADFSKPQEAAAIIAQGMLPVTDEDRRAAQAFAALYSWDALVKDSLERYAEAAA